MQLELTTDELECLVSALENIAPFDDMAEELHQRLGADLDEQRELESMDFSDCGDSCKV